jgi:hypothetical protein
LIVIEEQGRYIPTIGINQTSGGYFMNYHLNRPHQFYSNEIHPHDTRHETLIASRYSKSKDWFSASIGIYSIDERETPEDLPCRSVIRPFFVRPKSIRQIRIITDNALIIPDNIPGVLARVKVWPKKIKPTEDEIQKAWAVQLHPEPLIKVFNPEFFTNIVSIAVFSIDKLHAEFHFPFDGPLKPDEKGMAQTHPVLFRGPRKGRK